MSLFCDVESEEEKEGVEVFVKDDDDFWLKKEAVMECWQWKRVR